MYSGFGAVTVYSAFQVADEGHPTAPPPVTVVLILIVAGLPPMRVPRSLPVPDLEVQLPKNCSTVISNPDTVSVPLSVPAIQWISKVPSLTVTVARMQDQVQENSEPLTVSLELPVVSVFPLRVDPVHVSSRKPPARSSAELPDVRVAWTVVPDGWSQPLAAHPFVSAVYRGRSPRRCWHRRTPSGPRPPQRRGRWTWRISFRSSSFDGKRLGSPCPTTCSTTGRRNKQKQLSI